ncbi:MAG: phosphatase PAP2 family protein [Terriglobia bacterium]
MREQGRSNSFPSRERSALRPVSLVRFVPNILQDQKQIWLFPVRLLQGEHWKPTLIFLAILGALFMVDPYDPSYFRQTRAFQEFNRIVSGQHATSLMWVVMLSALALGLSPAYKYLRGTFFYSLEAILDSEILTQVLKGLDRRVRPQDMGTSHQFLASWFMDKGSWYSGPGSFPSGHMIAAISIATVFAIRYRRHSWAPWTAYGVAAIIGFSRITLLSHFPSDVFAGAVFGYVIARYVVLREIPVPPSEATKTPIADEDTGAAEAVGPPAQTSVI